LFFNTQCAEFLLNAIPFLLEDVLLDDIETLDFFLQKTANEQYYDVTWV
jgi:type II secretory pathway component PulL